MYLSLRLCAKELHFNPSGEFNTVPISLQHLHC